MSYWKGDVADALSRLMRVVAERDKEKASADPYKWGYFGQGQEDSVKEAEAGLIDAIRRALAEPVEQSEEQP